MSLFDSFRRIDKALKIVNRSEMIARYKHLRMVGQKLSSKLVKRLSKEMLHEGGKKLGILHRGTLVFNTEDEFAILMDYCLYDVFRKDRNTIEQYLIDFPPDEDSDEMTCLHAMQRAKYSLYLVESVEPGFGVTVRDLLSEETLLVVDMGLGGTAEAGMVFASRLLFHDGFAITGGAALPVGMLPIDQRDQMKKNYLALVPVDNGYFDPAPLINACLKKGCSEHIQYQEPSGRLVGKPRLAHAMPSISSPSRQNLAIKSESSQRVGRNDSCPCGSGKKFKNCCLRRQGG